MIHAQRLLALTVLVLSMPASRAAGPANAASPPPKLVTLEDAERIQTPGAPRLSPDGRQVAYVLDGRIYLVPSAGGTPRPITTAGSKASDPHWSRDGRSLYFLSDRAGKTWQLFRLSVDSFGEAEQVTTFERGIESLTFSPDESRLLLSFPGNLEDGKSDAAQEGKTAGQPKKPEPWVITRLHFKEDANDGYLTGDGAEHLYVYDLKAAKLRQITSGRFTESEAAWSPDGRSIVFASNRDDPDATYSTDLWVVDADNTDRGQSLRRLTDDAWVKGSPAWSPDGRTIAYITAEDGVYGLQHVAVVPAEGGTPRVLTRELDRWVDALRFSPDGEWIYFACEHLGGSQLARVRPRDGRLERVLEGEQQVSGFDVAKNGTVVARLRHMNDLPELHAIARGRVTRLTGINDDYLRSVVRATKEKIEFKSPDGTLVEAFVTKPPGFIPGKRYPAILHIHGGPVGQFSYGYNFWGEYLAAHGYLVVEPNPRGSTGRGQDFIRAIYQSWGITDYDDVIAAVDRVIELGWADPQRLAVTGYSYGGYMTNVVITRTKRFRAAVSGAGHSFIAANYGHDIYQKWYNWELGVPWENAEKYAKLSPLLHAGEVQTPTLFYGGRDDWNVPVLNAELFYQSLRQRGIDTQLVVYPGMHHGGWPPEFERDVLKRVREWFDKHLEVTPALVQSQ